MIYDKNEIMEIVREVLGDDANGVYINEEVINREIDADDASLYSSLDTPFEIAPTEKYNVYSGLTKICIVPKKKTSWVIKIPITDIYAEKWAEGEEDFSDYDSENFLGYKRVGEAISNLCDKEVSIYEDASESLKEVLSEINYIGNYNNIPIYIQERVKTIAAVAQDKDKHFILGRVNNFISNEIDRISDISCDFSNDFILNIILKIGFLNTIEVFEDISNEINDIHDWNYGYDYNGNGKLFDYSGYNRIYTYSFFEEGEVA